MFKNIITYTTLSLMTVLGVFSLASVSVNAQYGGTVITPPTSGSSSSSSSGSTSSSSGTTSTSSGSTSGCTSLTASSSVSGNTLTANLCGVKSGNVVNLNNLTGDIESLQITFDRDVNSGVFQIVRIPESLLLPGYSGSYITGYEVLTVNFDRSAIRSIKMTFKVDTSTLNQYTNINAYTSSSPWSGVSYTVDGTSGSSTRITSTVSPFRQFVITGTARSSSVSSSGSSVIGNQTGGLIRTGGSTTLMVSITSVSLVLILLATAYFNHSKQKIGLQLFNKSDLDL